MSDIQSSKPDLKALLLASVQAKGKVPYAGAEAKAKTATKKSKKLPVPPRKAERKATPAPRGSVALASTDFCGDLAVAARESAIDQGVIVANEPEPDTSDIPEAGQEFFEKATLKMPEPTSLPADLDDVPDFLRPENRVPLTPEQQAALDANLEKARSAVKSAAAPVAAEQKAVKTEKSRVRIEKLKAKQAGATAAMPLSGKAALAKIATPRDAKGRIMSKKSAAPVTGASEAPAATPVAPASEIRASAPTTRAGKAPRPGSKTAIIADLLRRKDGCTMAEVLAATGWPSVSMPQQAKAIGVALRKVKVPGKPTAYFAE